MVNGKWKKEKIKAGLIIAIKLHETLKKYFASTSLIFLGADSCATNTGWKNGAIGKKHAFEKYNQFILNIGYFRKSILDVQFHEKMQKMH